MEPAQFLTAPRVTIVAGKGGVGKTTTAARRWGWPPAPSDVRRSSSRWRASPRLPSIFGLPGLTYEEVQLVAPGDGKGELRARTLTPDDALVEYLQDHGLKRISNRLASSGALDMVATATPGIKDVLILGKIKQLERAAASGQLDADVIIVDAPAAGHAISFLRSARRACSTR